MDSFIRVRGAREHNLKNIDVDIPRNKFIAITGISGSGKSSLAFDTVYAEGQRRYVESLSSYARQFLEMISKPDVDSIEGLSPAISIEQKTISKNPRSTVGTITEIYDYLRLLFSNIGVPYSPATGLPIESQTISQMIDLIMLIPIGTKVYLLAPIIRGRKGEYRNDLQDLQKKGFLRVKIDGKLYDIDAIPSLNSKIKHDIEVVVDRLIVKKDIQARLSDSLEIALELADGIAIIENIETSERILFSEKFACPVSNFSIDKIEPRLFSFNTPYGACPSCSGLGVTINFTEDLIVPNKQLSLHNGAISPWNGSWAKYYLQIIKNLAKHYNFSIDTPFCDLSEHIRNIILHGSDDEVVPMSMHYRDETHSYSTKRPFEGVIPSMNRRIKETNSNRTHEDLSCFQVNAPCESCHGTRLKPETLAIKIRNLNIAEVCSFSITDARIWFLELHEHLKPQNREIAKPILHQINERLMFLSNVGLNYLTLSRNSETLSGGESQRIRLASQIGSGLTGVLYVLDEPSIGLHQRDNARLLKTLCHLRDIGNTVIIVEHDENTIRTADYIIDMGVGAGVCGGKIIAEGTLNQILCNQNSLTGKYLAGVCKVPLPVHRRSGSGKSLTIVNAHGNNLKNITVKIPLGTFTCITGVSGSGKSTLIIETFYKALSKHFNKGHENIAPHERIDGVENIDKIIGIDQSPIGRTPRSNPATYTGVFTLIRDLFASLPEAKARGYNVGRFSFNVKGGRCEACRGDGIIKIEMHFLSDVYVKCDVCTGKRYNREVLNITFKGKNIADILDMTVEEAASFFRAIPAIRDKLEALKRVGLSYICLGQQATTFSGGEAQRIKLAKELLRRSTGKTLYILDEPTTGLHFEDIKNLLEILHALVDTGNTVLVIEHNLDIIKTADWLIDLGPDGGDSGGSIVTTGTPEKISDTPESFTGQYLKKYLL
ncbi:MAG: excinuclease ABC subunit UvrA [Rhodospirillaceae bacterium]|jgi:excinuclease ABC subunit A|nr:excinuclease ABC subunit UvrA [Rhodospirillaceae bacterium]